MFVKRVFRLFVLTILWFWYRLLALFWHRQSGIAVLMYHSVGDTKWSFAINGFKFGQHLKYLRDSGFVFLSADMMAKIMFDPQEGIPAKSVLITFDDGYQDFADAALPVLQKYNAPAVVFVHTSRSSDELGNNFSLMDWGIIREVSNRGITIGNHSHSHPNLKHLARENLREELDKSEQLLETNLGAKPKFFAYPGGKLNSSVVEELNHRGYSLAFTVDEGLTYPGQDKMRIPRIGITNDLSFWEFKIKLTPVSTWYAKLRNVWR